MDRIILHDRYHHFKHDLVLMRLVRPANTEPNSRVRKICLPFADIKVNQKPFYPSNSNQNPLYYYDDLHVNDNAFPPPRDDNFLRGKRNENAKNATTAKIVISRLISEYLTNSTKPQTRNGHKLYSSAASSASTGRRNDKFSEGSFYRKTNSHFDYDVNSSTNRKYPSGIGYDGGVSDSGQQYIDCMATGWGKATIDDELPDVLLQTKAPIQNMKKYNFFLFNFSNFISQIWLLFCMKNNRLQLIKMLHAA